eukprot:3602265-Rhodomonas_salina.1
MSCANLEEDVGVSADRVLVGFASEGMVLGRSGARAQSYLQVWCRKVLHTNVRAQYEGWRTGASSPY